MDEILLSVRSGLGITDAVFDNELIMHINTAFNTLNQLGVGPTDSFSISDDEALWSTFIAGETNINMVRTFVFLTVRLIFDPPGTSFGISAIEKLLDEFATRLMIQMDPDLED